MIFKNIENFKFGKTPAEERKNIPYLSEYLPVLPVIPGADDWMTGHETDDWGMLGNDEVGDCTCAALGHQLQIWSLARSGKPVIVTPDQILSDFSAITGYVKGDPSTDHGANMLDVLAYAISKGIAGYVIDAWAKLNQRSRQHVETAIYCFGGAYVGLALPKIIQGQDIWDAPADGNLTGDAEPGSLGGHAVNAVSSDPLGLDVITWGQRQRMTWAFWNAYCDESFVLLDSGLWVPDRAPSGLDLAALKADLALMD